MSIQLVRFNQVSNQLPSTVAAVTWWSCLLTSQHRLNIELRVVNKVVYISVLYFCGLWCHFDISG